MELNNTRGARIMEKLNLGRSSLFSRFYYAVFMGLGHLHSTILPAQLLRDLV